MFWSTFIYSSPEEEISFIPEGIHESVWKNLLLVLKHEWWERDMTESITLEEFAHYFSDTAQIYGYLDSKSITTWNMLLFGILRQNPEVPYIQLHFYCSDIQRAFYFKVDLSAQVHVIMQSEEIKEFDKETYIKEWRHLYFEKLTSKKQREACGLLAVFM